MKDDYLDKSEKELLVQAYHQWLSAKRYVEWITGQEQTIQSTLSVFTFLSDCALIDFEAARKHIREFT